MGTSGSSSRPSTCVEELSEHEDWHRSEVGLRGARPILGFIAATRDFSPSSRADVGALAPRQAAAGAGVTGRASISPPVVPRDGQERATGPGRREMAGAAASTSSGKKPNILVIWGDDIGIHNISAYNHGIMGYKTPNIDRIGKEGAMFTDFYAQQSCTAGRASFISGAASRSAPAC